MTFDFVTVGVSIDRKGRFAAHRIYLRDGKVVGTEQLTTGRSLTYAIREARLSLEHIPNEWSRDELSFVEHEPLNVKVHE